MVVTLVAPHWLIFLLAIPSALRWVIRRSREQNRPLVASDEERFAMHMCPTCGQTFARVPPQCPVCRQQFAQGEFV
jgi:rubrerythrin